MIAAQRACALANIALSIHSRGFKGKELTKTLVVGASREPKAVYSQMMERFAREFLNGLNNLP